MSTNFKVWKFDLETLTFLVKLAKGEQKPFFGLKIFKKPGKSNQFILNTVLPSSFKLSGMTFLDTAEFSLELMREISIQTSLYLERTTKLK